jgi:hypothetical protein
MNRSTMSPAAWAGNTRTVRLRRATRVSSLPISKIAVVWCLVFAAVTGSLAGAIWAVAHRSYTFSADHGGENGQVPSGPGVTVESPGPLITQWLPGGGALVVSPSVKPKGSKSPSASPSATPSKSPSAEPSPTEVPAPSPTTSSPTPEPTNSPSESQSPSPDESSSSASPSISSSVDAEESPTSSAAASPSETASGTPV